MKKNHILCAAFAVVLLLLPNLAFARGRAAATDPGIRGNLTIATTTSTYDSGLLQYILPVFTAEKGWTTSVISVGTGMALQIGRLGEADVLLVHARPLEDEFVADGHSLARFDVMYNDFIVVGPRGVMAHGTDISAALREIADRNLPFVSRGDNSGTHVMELSLWETAGVDVATLTNYSSVGQGMGATLRITNEMEAFTLTDRATWLAHLYALGQLEVVCELDVSLLNFYGVLAVNPNKGAHINAQGAQDFIDWLLRPDIQQLIGGFGVEEFGEPLFTPNAHVN
ncbi:MAG: substrate-binding domain-containing protein [Spirochaetes bacterium]|nr:substrate-binding domain-containing protein [Spirochaetota bacterium]